MSKIINKKTETKKELKSKQQVSESLYDYLPTIVGVISSFAAIKLFGRKILLKILRSLFIVYFKSTCYKELEALSEYVIDNPENLNIQYKKIEDFYQIIIDLKVIPSEMVSLDVLKNPLNQLQSYNFPAKLKIYDNGEIEYFCYTEQIIKQKTNSDIYNEFLNFIKTYGEENTKIRSHGEDKLIADVLYKNLYSIDSSKLEDYNALASMDLNLINKISNEISKKLNIKQNIIIKAIEKYKPKEVKDEETPNMGKDMSDFVKNVYKEIIEYNDDESLKRVDSVEESVKDLAESVTKTFDPSFLTEDMDNFKKLINYKNK